MNNRQPPYHEKLLHWIWKNRHFEATSLTTTEGQEVQIHDLGKLNKSDGPDFKGAEITIGNLRWFGDVELHWETSDWRNHGHQHDSGYNKVILHVVFSYTGAPVLRQDQTTIPTLCLDQYISNPLDSFLHQYLHAPQLPCAKQLSFISEEAFHQQLNKAHKEYFEQKVDDLLAFYDPTLPPSRAWLKLFTVALFDGLGISYNRKPMRKLGKLLFHRVEESSSANDLRQKALDLSTIDNNGHTSNFNWSHKGSRPNNHPKHRIQQAALALWHLYNLPFEQWLHKDPEKCWNDLRSAITCKPSLGKERSAILFGTVFLPALYSLGNLLYAKPLKQRSWALWQTHEVSLPTGLLKALSKTQLPASCYNKKLGTIYQLRNYCRAGRCDKCFVFKNAISS